jgi:hypothetical protein
MADTAVEVLQQFKEEFPNLVILGELIEQDKQDIDDGIYSSRDTDNSSNHCYGYFEVKKNKIIAIGEERWRTGGWFWTKPRKG